LTEALTRYAQRLEELAKEHGLDYYPVQFEEVPSSFMMEIAVYGLPVRMPHWSFGVRYIYQLIQHRMGHSRLFEVVFPGNPGRAYLARNNSLQENTLVTAHVLGHADFARTIRCSSAVRSKWATRSWSRRLRTLARSATPWSSTGRRAVEQGSRCGARARGGTSTRGSRCAANAIPSTSSRRRLAAEARSSPASTTCPAARGHRCPARARAAGADAAGAPERDLLWLIAEYAPDLEEWERDIFRAVREGVVLLLPRVRVPDHERGLGVVCTRAPARGGLSAAERVSRRAQDALDVVRPHAAEQQASLVVNPYHLGFSIWESIVREHGIERAFQIRAEDDDFSFVRNYLFAGARRGAQAVPLRAGGGAAACACSITTFTRCARRPSPEVQLRRAGGARDAHREKRRLARSCSTSTPPTGAGLDLDRAERGASDYLHKMWRRPMALETIDTERRTKVLRRS